MKNDFIKWFLICVKEKYAVFDGRARRKEYWIFSLWMCLLGFITGAADEFFGLYVFRRPDDIYGLAGVGLTNTVASLALLVPGLAVSVRRLHDVGKSGWFLLLMLIPVLGWLYVLYLTVKDSMPGGNRFGPNPKGVEEPSVS